MKPSARHRTQPARPRHATATLLLDTTVTLLETVHMDDVNLAMVLERSGVSHGSLYHHFADFPDLVEQAVVVRFEAGLTHPLVGVRELLGSADAADFRRRAEELIIMAIAPERRDFRLSRIEVFAAAQTRPQLAEAVGRAQQRVIDEQAELYGEFQRRGGCARISTPSSSRPSWSRWSSVGLSTSSANGPSVLTSGTPGP